MPKLPSQVKHSTCRSKWKAEKEILKPFIISMMKNTAVQVEIAMHGEWVKRRGLWVKVRWPWLSSLARVAPAARPPALPAARTCQAAPGPIIGARQIGFAWGNRACPMLAVRPKYPAYRKIRWPIRFFLILDIKSGYADILDFLNTVQCPHQKTMPVLVLANAPAERSRAVSADYIRRRALQRLYDRRHAVEDLIRSLEGYEQCHKPCATASIDVIAARKCS
jgi:hypothetical protein